MKKIKLYIAVSIDGFIAKENHSLDWLNELPKIEGLAYGYNDFYNDIDVVIMGRRTYKEILGFDVDWPYENCKSFIVTSKKNYN